MPSIQSIPSIEQPPTTLTFAGASFVPAASG